MSDTIVISQDTVTVITVGTQGPPGSSSSLISAGIQTASFTAALNTYYPVDATAGPLVATLPTSVTSSQIVIKKSDTSTNTVTISGTINGAVGVITLRLKDQGKALIADGSGGWNTYAGDLSLTTLDARYLSTTTAAGGDLVGSFPNPTLVLVGTAATTGSASSVPVIITDTKGRVTAATATPIQITESQVTNLVSDLGAKALKTYVDSQDAAIQAQVTGNSTTIAAKADKTYVDAADATNASAIATETTNRVAANTTLQTNITAEAGSRTSADTALQGNITAEAGTRATADTALQTNITTEATTRATADTNLQTNITANTTAIASKSTKGFAIAMAIALG